MLEIRNLHAAIAETGKAVLHGIDLVVNAGEVHAIMGPNASGKSTLSKVICGSEDYAITAGDVRFEGKSITALEPEERARLGIFLSFQYPVEIPGISTAYFLRSALNAQRKSRGEPELDAVEFLKLAKDRMKLVQMEQALLNRPLNDGFSGGEKKRNEIFQMAVLEPRLAILDETDSGLDIDALRIVAGGVNALRRPDRAMLVITHYQRLLDYLVPDVTSVMLDGRIVKTGGRELGAELEKRGYDWIRQEVRRGTSAPPLAP
jgi:Fe-S cluster assembly ATP-binding protein